MRLAYMLFALALGAAPAYADDTPKPSPSTTNTATDQKSDATSKNQKSDTEKKSNDKTADQKTRDASEVMKLTQQAMKHIDAAASALQDGKTSAAKSALAQSKQVLDKLYKTPPATALLNEFDEVINSITEKGPSFEPLDLQPLRTSVSTYQAYVAPDVVAGIDTAQQQANKGDMKASENSLRLARNRVAIDMAFLPVEEAYTRVLAAQQALQSGDKKTALALIRNVPIVVSELQLSRPLLPIRIDLQAAADAADAQQWDRAKSLLQRASQQAQNLKSIADSSDVRSELTPIADGIQRLSRQAQAGTNPQPSQIRKLIRDTRSIGDETDRSRTQDDQG